MSDEVNVTIKFRKTSKISRTIIRIDKSRGDEDWNIFKEYITSVYGEFDFVKCECGAEKANSSKHSIRCDLYE